jgi:hypothetical protein
MSFPTAPDRPRRHRLQGALSVCCVAALVLSALAFVQDPKKKPAEVIRETRSMLERWVETRRLISQEKADWALGKETLVDRIALVRREVERLEGEIRENETKITDADRKLEDLVAENAELEAATAGLDETIAKLEDRARKLVARLPDPIAEQVRQLMQRIPEDPETAKLSVGSRFTTVAAILLEVNKFNGQVSIEPEERTLADGSTVSVTAVYVGLGQGYYASADGKAAGIGTVTAEGGWVWRPANDAGPEILRAIKILESEEVADFVPLPVRVQ